MSSLDADVNINLIVTDNASQPIDNSVKNIDRSFIQMRNSVRANERSFYLQHQSLYKFNQVMGTMRQVTGVGISVMNSLLLAQIRSADAARNLRDAQRDVNDAYAEFGPGSREYEDALQRQADLVASIKNDTIQQYTQWVLIGTMLASTIVPALLKIRGLLGGGIGKVSAGVSSVGVGAPVGNIPTITKGTIGGGPPGGVGGMGLIGPVALGISVAESILASQGITPQVGNRDIGFARLETIMAWKEEKPITIIINGSQVSGYAE